MIHLDHVTKSYHTSHGNVQAVHDVTLTISAGDFVALQGHSGSGKSTLLSLIGGLSRPTEGRVEILGEEISSLSSTARAEFRARHVGFVFQLFHLLPYLNVVDNVLMAAPTRQVGALREAAEELLRTVGLADRRLHRPAQLSAGERQRVAIARALLNRPQLLLADEPTGNLDEANAAAILDLMADFHRAGGTVLLATHDPAAAGRAARTLKLQAGRLSPVAAVDRGS